MSELLNPDDGSDGYLANREITVADATVDAFMRRMDSADTAKPQTTPSAAPQKPGPSVGDRALGVVKDVGKGIIEAPKQVIGGISDMVHNTFMAADSLADWLNENVADLTIPIPETGVGPVDKLLANPAEAIAGKKEEVSRGTSVTGGLVREAARFLSGFKLAKGAMGVEGVGFGAIPAGAVADFLGQDPDAARLADLWNKAGLPENVLTGYLESDPEDSEMEKRFKQALEGAALGTLAEGVFRGAKFLRTKWQAHKGAQTAGVQQLDEMAAAPKVTDRDFMLLGDPNEPLMKVSRAAPDDAAARAAGKISKAMDDTATGVPDDVTAKGVKAATRGAKTAGKESVGEPSVTINFARMDGPEEIKQVFRDTAEAFAPQIDEARRGVVTLAETEAMAKRLGMSPEDLLARTKGQAYNAEQLKAAGSIMDSATAKLFEIAEKAASPTASGVDHYMLRKMLAAHQGIQAEFLGAVAEAGRALNAIKIVQKGGSVETARAIQGLVQGMGGPEVGQALAQRLVLLKQMGMEDAAAQFARKGVMATTMDAVKETWINALLSSPTTHIVNTASNSMVVAMQVAERRVGELVSQAAGRPGIETGESAAMLYGLKAGLKDAFRSAWKAARTNESEIGKTLGKMDLPHGQFSGGAQNAISARAFGLDEAGMAGRAVDFIGNVTRTPGRLLMTEDEFFKTIGYRMELHAQAFRQASSEGLQGSELGKRVAQLVADPTEAIRLASADAALYNTFTNATGWFGQGLMKLRTQGGSANPLVFVLPFVRTPLNIARFAFERSPLAPLVGQWRADIAAGGARADLALARMGTGTGVMLLASDLAMSGDVSGRGPKDPGEREAMMRQGWQPYSIRAGDRWYSYNRSDPFGMTMGFASDFTEALNRGEIDPDDVDEWQEVMASMIGSVAQVSISKTYMRGLSEFFEMMGDPTRYAPNQVNRFIASFIPAGAAAVERLVDPVTREAFDPLQAIQARIAGLSERLTPARDLWGEERKPRSGLGTVYDTFSPVYASEVRDSPIDREMVRLVADVRRINKKSSFQGVDVNFRDWPKVYDAYVRLAGNDLPHPAWGMGAKDFLNEVVTGKHPMSEVYALRSDGRDGGKVDFIRDTIRSYREMAQRKILGMPEFEDFREYIENKKRVQREAAMPS